MAKLILLGIVLFTSILPVTVSASKNPRRTIKRIQIMTGIAVCIWAYLCRNWYPELVPVE